MFDNGLFGGLFDFNGDGNPDSFETAAEFSFFMEMVSEEDGEEENESESDFSDDCGFSDIEDTADLEDVLEEAGIDMLDFELMNNNERAEILWNAGYDIDDFDFDV